MFGRDLIEQAQYDSRGDDRQVPILVEKCIQAVEAIGTARHSPLLNELLKFCRSA